MTREPGKSRQKKGITFLMCVGVYILSVIGDGQTEGAGD